MTKKGAIWAAYTDTGALGIDCPTCGATPGTWCTREDGRVRRIPCIARATTTAVVNVDRQDRHRDFSEPLHPRGEPA